MVDMSNDIDYQILLQMFPILPDEVIEKAEHVLANNLAEYMRFCEIKETAGKRSDETALTIDKVKKEWRQYTKSGGLKFDELVEKYFIRYKENAKEKRKKGTVLQLNSELSGHNKWYRMLKDHGMGPQYHDDIRKLCFLFELSYLEAIEFLWSAGQPLDNASTRDFVIADCLVKKIYKQEKVNECLAELGQTALFQYGG